MAYNTVVEDNIDILVAGAGLGGTGAAFEARYWGKNKKIVIAEKANIDRSGAVAQGLYAINCYMGTRWGENNQKIMCVMHVTILWAWFVKIFCLIWRVTSIQRYTCLKNGAYRL